MPIKNKVLSKKIFTRGARMKKDGLFDMKMGDV